MKALAILLSVLLLLNLSACSNQFGYRENDWIKVTETKQGNRKVVYLDKNRVECKDGQCRAWIKMVFANQEPVNFNGNKDGEVSGYMMVQRVDSGVDYDCTSKTARIYSYQLYDREAKMMDSKWIQGDLESARPGTVHGDILKFICK